MAASSMCPLTNRQNKRSHCQYSDPVIHPTHPHYFSLGIQVGDWTQELFRLSLEDPRIKMPIWITAAQPSVLEKSIFFDNGESASTNPT